MSEPTNRNHSRSPVTADDIRIEIHGSSSQINTIATENNMNTEYPTVDENSTLSSEEMNTRRTEDQPNNINLTNFLSEASNTLGLSRNIQDVLQGVRPLAQNTYMNNLRTWMPSSSATLRYIPLFRNEPIAENNDHRPATDSEINQVQSNDSINVNMNSPEERVADVVRNSVTSSGGGGGTAGGAPSSPTADIGGRISAGTGNRIFQDRVVEFQRTDSNLSAGGDSQVPAANENNTNGRNDVEDETIVSRNLLFRYFPYIIILLIKITYDHLKGIFDILILFGVFVQLNSIIRNEIARQSQRRNLILMREFLYLILFFFYRYFFIDDTTFDGLLLLTSHIPFIVDDSMNMCQMLFYVAVTDYLLKLITMMLKICIAAMPASLIKFKRRVRKTSEY